MEWLIFIGEIVILLGLGVLALFAKSYLPSYTKEKGKNLATKEDIKQIRDKIESVKNEYAEKLEGLKSQLNAKFHAHTVRFEKEFQCYTDIWEKVVDLRKLFEEYRLQVSKTEPESVDLKSELSKKFLASYMNLDSSYEKNRPFFADEVYETISNLLRKPTIRQLAIHDARTSSQYDDSPDRLEELFKVGTECEEIETQMDEVCKAIRRQIERLDNPKDNS